MPHSSTYTHLHENHLLGHLSQPNQTIGIHLKQEAIAILLSKSIPLNEYSATYEKVNDLFRELNDAQFNIISSRTNYEGQAMWLRDATNAIALEKRMPHDSAVIEAHNALLRCLSRLRPIDYAIERIACTNSNELRTTLFNEFSQTMQLIHLTLLDNAYNNAQKLERISQFEAIFNTQLIQALHKADLTQGIETQAEAEYLLFYYRNLSSVLTPALPMATRSIEKTTAFELEEIQFPITRKTPFQKKAFANIIRDLPHTHTPTKGGLATELADRIFMPLIEQDDRSLPAQTRKTHLVSVKNAFLVRHRLTHPDSPPSELWIARIASPVYIGKNHETSNIVHHTKENLIQVLNTGQFLIKPSPTRLHLLCLNSNIPWNDEDRIVQGLKKIETPHLTTSNIAINTIGTLLPSTHPGGKTSSRRPLQKATRLIEAAQTVSDYAADPSTISAVNCASGQDRTGGVHMEIIATWLVGHGINRAMAERCLAEGMNMAEVASHLVQGSAGLKDESIPYNYPFFGKALGKSAFSKTTIQQLYRASAHTNKKNRVNNIAFLKVPTDTIQAATKKLFDEYKRSLTDGKPCYYFNELTPCPKTLEEYKGRSPAYVFDTNTLIYIDKANRIYEPLALNEEQKNWLQQRFIPSLHSTNAQLSAEKHIALVSTIGHDRGHLTTLLYETGITLAHAVEANLADIPCSSRQWAYLHEILWHTQHALKNPNQFKHLDILISLSKTCAPPLKKTVQATIAHITALLLTVAAYALAPLTFFASMTLIPVAIGILVYVCRTDHTKTSDKLAHIADLVENIQALPASSPQEEPCIITGVKKDDEAKENEDGLRLE